MGEPGNQGPQGPEGPQGPSGSTPDGGTPRSAIFAGPGLHLEITDASVADGTATATFKVTNGDGEPLDINGEYTPGKIGVSFIIARMTDFAGTAGGLDGWQNYSTRTQTSPITMVSADQPSTDSGGTFEELEPGVYKYTFGTTVTPPDASATHRIAAYADRELEGTQYIDNAEYDFVPDGSGGAETHATVAENACNACHGQLSAHGGERRDVALCVTCHTQDDAIDPDTGNSISFKRMLHKIHMGANLPTVAEDGIPYQIIGYMQRPHDYSDVVFPQPVNHCTTCHQGPDAEDYWMRPTMAACTSCHDKTSFVDPPPAGKVLHTAGPQPNDSMCTNCHDQYRTIGSYVTGIIAAHYVPFENPANSELTLSILSISNTDPGMSPTVRFQVEVDGMPRDIIANPLPTLRATIAGPNSDYAQVFQSVIQGSGATGTLVAFDAAAGQFDYTFPPSQTIPMGASGSYTAGMEGYLLSVDGERLPPALDPTMAFKVAGPDSLMDRRMVVDTNKCNNCHLRLEAHGGNRTNAQYCVTCHNPNAINDATSPEDPNPVVIEPIDFKVLIHKVHNGANLTQDYTIFNYRGSPVNFDEVAYPQDVGNCAACHTDETYELPLGPNVLPAHLEVHTCSEDPAADMNATCAPASQNVVDSMTIYPTAAVCTSCHDASSTVAHAQVMTTAMGLESCATCHGPGDELGVSSVHNILTP